MKKIIIGMLCLFMLTACGNKKEKLVLVTEAGFAPYEYYDNGEIVGVDIDIAKRNFQIFPLIVNHYGIVDIITAF